MGLKELNEEYMEWKSNIEGADTADNLMQGATYEKLEQVEALEVEEKMDEVESLVQELYDIVLPVGFGRD
jgi:protein subunit release factor A